MDISSLQKTARALVAPRKGILAADESSGTIKKRFEKIGVESTEENRRAYRELLFTTPNIGEYISGVILYDETIRQSAADGAAFTTVLSRQGIIPGIKVDKGVKPLAFSPDEAVTEGLDGLRERLAEYAGLGARFAKWRAVIKIAGGELPTDYCVHVNAHALARYAALCQESGLVPIVEPEVLMDGAHGIDRAYDVTLRTLKAVFGELKDQRVDLSGILLKPNMAISGSDFGAKDAPSAIAEMTIKCFREAVPADVPGIVFLSGGQSEQEACENLNALNATGQPLTWQLSFSYGRALQASALKAWGGKAENIGAGQQAFAKRAKLVSAARAGEYSLSME